MTPLRALILGIIQGAAEFLPISSSGHLILIPRLFGWPEQPLAYDVALHIGTFLAIAIYFRRDWSQLIVESGRDFGRHRLRFAEWGPHGRLALLLVAGTVPAVLAGVALSSAEQRLRTPGVVAAMLILVGLLMAAVERWGPRPQASGLERLTLRRTLLIGVAQACSLVPGVSRSGATIVAGMATGLSRTTAARFSFLLAMPVTLAAIVKEVPELRHAGATGISGVEIGIGIVSSFAVGIAAIALLLRYLATRPLYVFTLYRIGLALVVLAVLR